MAPRPSALRFGWFQPWVFFLSASGWWRGMRSLRGLEKTKTRGFPTVVQQTCRCLSLSRVTKHFVGNIVVSHLSRETLHRYKLILKDSTYLTRKVGPKRKVVSGSEKSRDKGGLTRKTPQISSKPKCCDSFHVVISIFQFFGQLIWRPWPIFVQFFEL